MNLYFCSDNVGIDRTHDDDDSYDSHDSNDSDDDIYAVPIVDGDYVSGSGDYWSGSGSGDYWYGSGSGDYWYGSGSGDYWYGSGSGDYWYGSGSGDYWYGSGSGDYNDDDYDDNGKPMKPSGGDNSDYNPIFVSPDGNKGSDSGKKPFTGTGTGILAGTGKGTRPGVEENQMLLNFLSKQKKKLSE